MFLLHTSAVRWFTLTGLLLARYIDFIECQEVNKHRENHLPALHHRLEEPPSMHHVLVSNQYPQIFIHRDVPWDNKTAPDLTINATSSHIIVLLDGAIEHWVPDDHVKNSFLGNEAIRSPNPWPASRPSTNLQKNEVQTKIRKHTRSLRRLDVSLHALQPSPTPSVESSTLTQLPSPSALLDYVTADDLTNELADDRMHESVVLQLNGFLFLMMELAPLFIGCIFLPLWMIARIANSARHLATLREKDHTQVLDMASTKHDTGFNMSGPAPQNGPTSKPKVRAQPHLAAWAIMSPLLLWLEIITYLLVVSTGLSFLLLLCNVSDRSTYTVRLVFTTSFLGTLLTFAFYALLYWRASFIDSRLDTLPDPLRHTSRDAEAGNSHPRLRQQSPALLTLLCLLPFVLASLGAMLYVPNAFPHDLLTQTPALKHTWLLPLAPHRVFLIAARLLAVWGAVFFVVPALFLAVVSPLASLTEWMQHMPRTVAYPPLTMLYRQHGYLLSLSLYHLVLSIALVLYQRVSSQQNPGDVVAQVSGLLKYPYYLVAPVAWLYPQIAPSCHSGWRRWRYPHKPSPVRRPSQPILAHPRPLLSEPKNQPTLAQKRAFFTADKLQLAIDIPTPMLYEEPREYDNPEECNNPKVFETPIESGEPSSASSRPRSARNPLQVILTPRHTPTVQFQDNIFRPRKIRVNVLLSRTQSFSEIQSQLNIQQKEQQGSPPRDPLTGQLISQQIIDSIIESIVQTSSQPSDRQENIQASHPSSSEPSDRPPSSIEPVIQPLHEPIGDISTRPVSPPVSPPKDPSSSPQMTLANVEPSHPPSSEPSIQPSIHTSSEPSNSPVIQPTAQPIHPPIHPPASDKHSSVYRQQPKSAVGASKSKLLTRWRAERHAQISFTKEGPFLTMSARFSAQSPLALAVAANSELGPLMNKIHAFDQGERDPLLRFHTPLQPSVSSSSSSSSLSSQSFLEMMPLEPVPSNEKLLSFALHGFQQYLDDHPAPIQDSSEYWACVVSRKVRSSLTSLLGYHRFRRLDPWELFNDPVYLSLARARELFPAQEVADDDLLFRAVNTNDTGEVELIERSIAVMAQQMLTEEAQRWVNALPLHAKYWEERCQALTLAIDTHMMQAHPSVDTVLQVLSAMRLDVERDRVKLSNLPMRLRLSPEKREALGMALEEASRDIAALFARCVVQSTASERALHPALTAYRLGFERYVQEMVSADPALSLPVDPTVPEDVNSTQQGTVAWTERFIKDTVSWIKHDFTRELLVSARQCALPREMHEDAQRRVHAKQHFCDQLYTFQQDVVLPYGTQVNAVRTGTAAVTDTKTWTRLLRKAGRMTARVNALQQQHQRLGTAYTAYGAAVPEDVARWEDALEAALEATAEGVALVVSVWAHSKEGCGSVLRRCMKIVAKEGALVDVSEGTQRVLQQLSQPRFFEGSVHESLEEAWHCVQGKIACWRALSVSGKAPLPLGHRLLTDTCFIYQDLARHALSRCHGNSTAAERSAQTEKVEVAIQVVHLLVTAQERAEGESAASPFATLHPEAKRVVSTVMKEARVAMGDSDDLWTVHPHKKTTRLSRKRRTVLTHILNRQINHMVEEVADPLALVPSIEGLIGELAQRNTRGVDDGRPATVRVDALPLLLERVSERANLLNVIQQRCGPMVSLSGDAASLGRLALRAIIVSVALQGADCATHMAYDVAQRRQHTRHLTTQLFEISDLLRLLNQQQQQQQQREGRNKGGGGEEPVVLDSRTVYDALQVCRRLATEAEEEGERLLLEEMADTLADQQQGPITVSLSMRLRGWVQTATLDEAVQRWRQWMQQQHVRRAMGWMQRMDARIAEGGPRVDASTDGMVGRIIETLCLLPQTSAVKELLQRLEATRRHWRPSAAAAQEKKEEDMANTLSPPGPTVFAASSGDSIKSPARGS